MFVVCESFAKLSATDSAQIRIVPVEIVAVAQFKAADVTMVDPLRETDGIGHRHQHDLGVELANGFKAIRPFARSWWRLRARRFVGMQCSLNVGLAVAICRAKCRLTISRWVPTVLETRVAGCFHGESIKMFNGGPRGRCFQPTRFGARKTCTKD